MPSFEFPGQTNFYRGKVRDVYSISDKLLVMIASNRISAFDVILPREIPYKGQVLNQIAAYMLRATTDICANWLLDVPTPDTSIGIKCSPLPVEVVVRGNLTGHAWRTYSSGKRMLCGVTLPEGLKENDFFPEPIITPTTKAAKGHDEDISVKEIIENGIVKEDDWKKIEAYSYALFDRGRSIALKQGLVLADTKYEFGQLRNDIVLMDEIHTPDSSRYFYADAFDDRQKTGEKQIQLSKEFVREWLMHNNFMGRAGDVMPQMTDEWVETISNRYIQLYEKVIGEKFIPAVLSDADKMNNISIALKKFEETGYTISP